MHGRESNYNYFLAVPLVCAQLTLFCSGVCGDQTLEGQHRGYHGQTLDMRHVDNIITIHSAPSVPVYILLLGGGKDKEFGRIFFGKARNLRATLFCHFLMGSFLNLSHIYQNTDQYNNDQESHGVGAQLLVDLRHQERPDDPGCAAEGVEQPQPVAGVDVANNLGEDGGAEGEREGVAHHSQDEAQHELRDSYPGHCDTPLVPAPGVGVTTTNHKQSTRIFFLQSHLVGLGKSLGGCSPFGFY